MGVTIVHTEGPGDLLRFFHAARQWCELKPGRYIVAFTTEDYRDCTKGLLRGDNDLEVLHDSKILWVVLAPTFPNHELENYLKDMLSWLQRYQYEWRGKQPRRILVPYIRIIDGMEKNFASTLNVCFRRIDLCVELMETKTQLQLEVPEQRMSPGDIFNIMLFLRVHNCQPGRNTPWYQVRKLTEFVKGRPAHACLYFGGCKTKDESRFMLQAIYKAAQQFNDEDAACLKLLSDQLNQFGSPYQSWPYGGKTYLQQYSDCFNFHMAVGVNSSGLDLFAAAGVPLLREFEWKARRYKGKYYNTFLCNGLTLAINNWCNIENKPTAAYSDRELRFTTLFDYFTENLARGKLYLQASTSNQVGIYKINLNAKPHIQINEPVDQIDLWQGSESWTPMASRKRDSNALNAGQIAQDANAPSLKRQKQMPTTSPLGNNLVWIVDGNRLYHASNCQLVKEAKERNIQCYRVLEKEVRNSRRQCLRCRPRGGVSRWPP